MLCQFGKQLFETVRRLPDKFIGKCSGCFRCLCVVYCFVNASLDRNVKDFVHKNAYVVVGRLVELAKFG